MPATAKTTSDPYGDGSGHQPCPKCGFCQDCEGCKCHGCGEPVLERALAAVNGYPAEKTDE